MSKKRTSSLLREELAEAKSESEKYAAICGKQAFKIKDLEKECQEQARLNGMGAEREAKLQSELAEARKEIERLKEQLKESRRITNYHETGDGRSL